MRADPDSASPASQKANGRVRRMEIIISYVLRAGVIASLAIVVAGSVISFIHHPEYVSSSAALQRLTRPGAAFPHTLSDVAAGVRHMQGQAIVALGLIVLILTPVMRVAVSILAFIYQGDRAFTLVTIAVLCILLLSFVLGWAG